MTFNPNAQGNSNKERDLIPSGIHAARCARIIEVGKQHAPKFDREDEETGQIIKAISDKVIVIFSLSNVLFDFPGLGERQAFISNRYGITKSTNDRSTMRQYTKALDPQGQATCLADLLNKPCQVSIKHTNKDGKVYANLDSVAPILPGFAIPELDTEPFIFEWDNPDMTIWEKLNDFTKDMIKGATNYHGSKIQKALEEAGEIEL